MKPLRDEFLSEEDLDLKSLTDQELELVWTHWLEQAQVTNDADRYEYSHGTFLQEPPWPATLVLRSSESSQLCGVAPARRT